MTTPDNEKTYTAAELWALERKYRDEQSDLRLHNSRLRSFLTDLFDKLIAFSIFLWAVVYLGAVGWAWYWKEDRPLGIAIALSLTVAHSAVAFTAYLRRKRKELTETK
jgi:hypothetical protein